MLCHGITFTNKERYILNDDDNKKNLRKQNGSGALSGLITAGKNTSTIIIINVIFKINH